MTRAAIGALLAAAVLLPRGVRGAGVEGMELVARVNGDPVSRAELVRMQGNPLTAQELRREAGDDASDAEALDRLALRKLIRQRLLLQEAARRGISVGDRELDEAIAALRGRFGDLKEFGAWMKAQGLDDRTLFDAVRADMTAARAWAALVEGAAVPDEEVRRYHEAHRDELRPDEVRLRLIAVRDEATADAVVAALRRGEDFARVARARSVGKRAASGGDTGWIAAAGLPRALREYVAPLGVGEARGPLRAGAELLVVRLEGRRRGEVPALADARPRIEAGLLPARRQAVVEAWLRAREAEARIEVFTAGARAQAEGGR